MTHPSLARLGHFIAPLQATCSTCGAVKDAKNLYCANGYQCRECYDETKGEEK
jgi:hypothetical protein